MRKFVNMMIAALIAAMAPWGCTKTVVRDSLELKGEIESLAAMASGNRVELEFISTSDWIFRSNADWVIVSPSSGRGSFETQKVVMTMTRNASPEERTAEVILYGSGQFIPIPVAQAGASDLVMFDGEPSVSFDCKGGESSFRIVADKQWSAECDAPWVELSPSEGKPSGLWQTVVFAVAANEGEARKAVLTVSAGGSQVKAIEISQEAFKSEGEGGGETPELYGFGGGSGTEAAPFLIDGAENLLKFAELASDPGYSALYYRQTADIDLASYNYMPACSDSSSPFRGVYDGDGHSISGVAMRDLPGKASAGFIAYADGASIRNLSVRAAVRGNSNDGTGGIVGHALNTEISSCRFEGNVNSEVSYVGGIVGYLDGGSISDCSVASAMLTAFSGSIGGLVGAAYGVEISNCTADVKVSARNSHAAGIAGVFQDGTMKGCSVSRNSVVNGAMHCVGGLVGSLVAQSSVVVDGCSVASNVTGGLCVGGLCGCIEGRGGVATVINCQVIGNTVEADYWDSASYVMAAGGAGRIWGSGKVNLVNLHIAPSCLMAGHNDIPASSTGGGFGSLLGAQAGVSLNVHACWSPIATSEILQAGVNVTASKLSSGRWGFTGDTAASGVSVSGCAWLDDMNFGYRNASLSSFATESSALSSTRMKDGTLLSRLNAAASAWNSTGAAEKALEWTAGADGYPVIVGLPSISVPKAIRVSLFGDSISTYAGVIRSEYDIYYPRWGDLAGPNETYWGRLIYEKMSSAVLDMNSSCSGSCVASTPSATENYMKWDFGKRFIEFGAGRPDVILINGGTNDNIVGHKWGIKLLGSYAAEGSECPTDAEMQAAYDRAAAATTFEEAKALPARTFVEAYCRLLQMIHIKYPDCRVVNIIGDGNPSGAHQAMVKMGGHYRSLYGYRTVDLYEWNGYRSEVKIPKVNPGDLHPNAAGHRAIADYIYSQEADYLEGTGFFAE